MQSMNRQRLSLSGGTELCFTTAGAASKPAVLLLQFVYYSDGTVMR